MPTESIEVQLARMDEKFKTMLEEMHANRNGRKDQYEQIGDLSRLVSDLISRVKNVEYSLAKNAPTIDEFIEIKHKVVGAGILGKWVWGILGATIAFIYASREVILGWIRGG